MRTPEQNKDVVRRFNDEVFNAKNMDALDELLSDDFVEHQAMPGMPPDRKGAMQMFEAMFGSSPDMRAEIVHLVASGDRVAVHGVYNGTDTGGSCRAWL